jgi:gas vesicle protein
MGEDPSQIRQEIDETRARMGDTVEALGHKADVPGRAKDAVSGKVEQVRSKVSGATPDGDLKGGARRAAGIAQENPLGLGIAAVAAGFIAGLLVPSTGVEDEKIGPLADRVKEKAKDTGQEALERGKQVAGEAAETAKESAAGQAAELRDSAQQRADEARNA